MMGNKGNDYLRISMLLVTLFWLAGCAGLPMPTQSEREGTDGLLGSCADFFSVSDRAVVDGKVMDAGVFRVEGYPYLRTDRFLASFGKQAYDPTAFADWIDRLQALDQEARWYEIANLPDDDLSQAQKLAALQKVADCGNLLKQEDFAAKEARQGLRRSISTPDEYIGARRMLGLYPLTDWFVSRGVAKWHDEARRSFSPEPPPDWQTIMCYSPPEAEALPAGERIAALVERDALGVPQYTPETLEALFAIHAPVWEVETQGDGDRIGKPFWAGKDDLQIDVNAPVTFTKVNFTRFETKILTQLNYVIWFPARSKTGVFDLYGGKFDGIDYRVTLDVDGAPLLYETIHNCGCFYKAYSTKRLKLREEIEYAEPPLIFKAPPIDSNSEAMVVALESRTHYVQHLYARPRGMRPEKRYVYLNYNELRSLPLPKSGRRGMFGQDGIVHGSQRLERFLLWPSGVFSPGAMRQWGRHAVALVGKRHFDDPFYIEKIFKQSKSVPESE